MAIIPPGFADMALAITRAGDDRPYLVTWAIEIETPPFTVADLTEWADELATNVAFRAGLRTDERMLEIRATPGQDGTPLQLSVPIDAAGTSSADRLPQNCAGIISKRSAQGGRRNRGRMFWPSLQEGSVDNVGVMATPQLTILNNIAQSLYGLCEFGAPFNSAGMVILHSVPPATPTPVTQVNVQPVIGTQRRRLRR